MWPLRSVVAKGVIDVEAVHAVRREVYLPHAQQVVSEHGLAPERAEDLLPSTLEMAGWLRTGSREAFVVRLDARIPAADRTCDLLVAVVGAFARARRGRTPMKATAIRVLAGPGQARQWNAQCAGPVVARVQYVYAYTTVTFGACLEHSVRHERRAPVEETP